MADVYISFAAEDEKRVAFIQLALESQGLSVWRNNAGDDLRPPRSELARQARMAKCVVVVWSESSARDPWIETEAEQALKSHKLCSVLLDNVRLTELFYRGRVCSLTRWNDSFEDPHLQEFLQTVRVMIKGPDRPPLPPVTFWDRLASALSRFALLVAFIVVIAGALIYWPAIQDVLSGLGQGASSGSGPTRPNPGGGGGDNGYLVDCHYCPKMVVVPRGSFKMGDPNAFWRANSMPTRDVRIRKKFAVSLYEVTWHEWQMCVVDGGCRNAKPGYGLKREKDDHWVRHPVTNISWHDATDYVRWLRSKTRKHYRLLTEAEWEYVARAGAKTNYSFGDDDARLCEFGNGKDLSAYYSANRNEKCYDHFGDTTSPAGAFRPNRFGLFDMHGNVWEWVEDCYHSSYEGAPKTERAWMSGECKQRVMRGGSWNSKPAHLRSAYRARRDAHSRGDVIGFRVARRLD